MALFNQIEPHRLSDKAEISDLKTRFPIILNLFSDCAFVSLVNKDLDIRKHMPFYIAEGDIKNHTVFAV